MTKQTHTPTPWAYEIRSGMGPDGTQFVSVCTGDKKRTIASLGYNETTYSREPDAAFIVRAVNNHAALVEALGMAIRALQDNDIDAAMAGEFEILTDALAQARA